MNQQEKLRQRRVEQEKKIRERRKKLGIGNYFSKKFFSRDDKFADTNTQEEQISEEDVSKVIDEYSIKDDNIIKISDAPENETSEERINRLNRLRAEIYNKHKQAIEKKHEEALERIEESRKKQLQEEADRYKEQISSHDSDLNDALEDADDSEDRREARKNHKELIREEKDTSKENQDSINIEHDDSIESLQEELNEKLEELEEKFTSDCEDILDGHYKDEDLELCQKDFEAEIITFDTLEEYEEDESYSSDTDNYSSSGLNLPGILIGILGMGIVIMVCFTMLDVITKTIEATNASSTDYTSVTSFISGIGITPTTFIVLITPIVFIMVWRLFNGFGRGDL